MSSYGARWSAAVQPNRVLGGLRFAAAARVDPHKPPAATKLGDPAVTATPPTWYSGEYRYDAAGNITAIGATSALYADGKPTLNGDGKSNAYGYDSAGRLLRATANNTAEGSESYRYDSFGNLVERTRDTSAQSVTSQISVSLATNRVNGASYDAAGNLTNWPVTGETYDYDASNMVVAKRASATSAAEVYLYTADDERIATRRTDSSWRWTVRDFDGKVLREYESASDSPSATWAWVEDYVYRDGSLFAATRPLAQGGTRHFHLDHLGTPRLITGANGLAIAVHDYFPYGSEQTVFNQEMTNRGYDRPEPMTFTGHERDYTEGTAVPSENFVDSMHARYYGAAWGRFLTVDPVIGDPSTPQSWNRYSYVRNNPMNRTDPDGRWDFGTFMKDVGSALGFHWMNDSHARMVYNAAKAPLVKGTPGADAARTAAKVATRQNLTTPGGATVAETMRPMAQEASRVGGNPAAGNAAVDAAFVSPAARAAGPVLAAASLTVSVVRIANAPEGQGDRTTAGESGALLGANSFGEGGAWAGAAAGGAIGAAFGGVGAVPGAIIGGFVGLIGGGAVGGHLGEQAAHNFYDATVPRQ